MAEELNQEQHDAAEAAAFEAAFHEQRQELDESHSDSTPEPSEESTPAPAAQEPAPDGGSAPEPVAEADTPKTVLAGLTEEQVTQALARVSQQQMTIDKLGGRIGQLMQQVEKLNSQPRTAADQRSFDLKLEKLGEAFPELAEMLREDLKGLSGAPAQAGDQPQVQTFTAEDVNNIVAEKLTAFQQQQERGLEVRMLSTAHPDWEQTIRTPQFALWRDNVISDGKELMESENAAFISLRLTQFKDWVKSTTSPVHQAPAVTSQRQAPNQRLANAVLPRGQAAQAAPGPASEEDAFMAAFKAERSKSGY